MIAKILFISQVTHDVRRFIIEKPDGFEFTSGQATEVAINQKGWTDRKRPFTFTSVNSDLVLEFIIKEYPVLQHPDHEGMTEKLHTLESGDELIIEKPWGTINYKGKGVFVAGGAGITPFISIFRQLNKDGDLTGNKLIFSNKEVKDIILEKELRNHFGEDAVFTLTREQAPGYEYGRVDGGFIEKHVDDFSQNFYVCGPSAMVSDIRNIIRDKGADMDSIVFEK